MMLKRIPKRFNIVRRPGKAPGNWAGTLHFIKVGSDRLIDPKTNNQTLQYLHWAGMKIQPGCPYWEIWEHYRYLNESKPQAIIPTQPTWLQRAAKKILATKS
jgi:hypothetical protein